MIRAAPIIAALALASCAAPPSGCSVGTLYDPAVPRWQGWQEHRVPPHVQEAIFDGYRSPEVGPLLAKPDTAIVLRRDDSPAGFILELAQGWCLINTRMVPAPLADALIGRARGRDH